MAGDSAGFESYLRGSWWDVQVRDEQSSMFLVSYNAHKDEDWAWVPSTELRLSSRRGDGWDCYLLKIGMDVSVLSRHPHSISFNLEKEGLYDARVSSVARSVHPPGECTCKFFLHFYSVKMNTYRDGGLLDRILLIDEPETQVSITDIRILQKPTEGIPSQDVLQAHEDRRWIPIGRGCLDTHCLNDSQLSMAKWLAVPSADDASPTHVRSDEVLSPSAVRLSTKNGDNGSNCNSPADGLEQVARVSKQSPGTPSEEDRKPNTSSGGPENQKHKQSGERADGTTTQTSNIKRKCVAAEDQDADRLNGIKDKETPKKTRGPGRPRQQKPDKLIKQEQVLVCEKMRSYFHGKILPPFDKVLRSRRKEKTKYKVEVKHVDLEWTENLTVLSDDNSDSEDEWKPGLKDGERLKPRNIRAPHHNFLWGRGL